MVEEMLEKSVELKMAVETPPNEPKQQLRQKKYSASEPWAIRSKKDSRE